VGCRYDAVVTRRNHSFCRLIEVAQSAAEPLAFYKQCIRVGDALGGGEGKDCHNCLFLDLCNLQASKRKSDAENHPQTPIRPYSNSEC
jgi:hypothetical protein